MYCPQSQPRTPCWVPLQACGFSPDVPETLSGHWTSLPLTCNVPPHPPPVERQCCASRSALHVCSSSASFSTCPCFFPMACSQRLPEITPGERYWGASCLPCTLFTVLLLRRLRTLQSRILATLLVEKQKSQLQSFTTELSADKARQLLCTALITGTRCLLS